MYSTNAQVPFLPGLALQGDTNLAVYLVYITISVMGL